MNSSFSEQTDSARTGPPTPLMIFKRAPISCLCVLTLLGMFAVVEIDRAGVPENQGHLVMQEWGMAPELVSVPEPKLHGPFDLWEGDWWRIPVSVVHHGGTQHSGRVLTLLMVCAAIGYLGYWIEPLFPKLWFLWLLLISGLVCLMCEFLLGHTFNGATGMGWGLFGALLVVRTYDRDIAHRFTLRTVRTAWLVLIVSLVLQLFTNEHLPAVGWLMAACFGWFTARVRLDPPARPFSAMLVYGLAHLLFLPAFHYATHPEWVGRYHWYIATHTNTNQPIEHLYRAVKLNPKLAGAWYQLVARTHDNGDVVDSWELALQALNQNRSDGRLQKLAQDIWLRITVNNKTEVGLATLKEVFKEEADHWRKFLKLDEQRLRIPRIVFDEPNQEQTFDPEEEFALDQQLILPDFSNGQETPLEAPQIDPNEENSASEGVAL